MACNLQLQCLLLFSYLASTLANPALLGEPNKTIQHSPSYQSRPRDFTNERLYRAYHVIQRFKRTITSDPKYITSTWTGHDICGDTTYIGFYCDTPGRDKMLTVTAVILNGYGLRAPTLQGFINQLPDLAFFHAASNYFGADVPLLAGLTYLYKLNVSAEEDIHPQFYTDVRGRGTSGTGKCITATINFDFTINTDPKEGRGHHVPGVTDAKALILNYNNLSGPLPTNLGFSKLSYLALANNKLMGPIPASIGQLQDSVLEILLLNNQLSGCLPHELGMLYKAAVIDAGMNQLTGPIPSSFSCLISIEQLNLAGNRLYGDVPDSLCKLAGPAGRLTNLTLSGNYFTSVGPACAKLIKDRVLDVKNNCIPGLSNQRRPAECAAFHSQPKTCQAVTTQMTCPAASATNAPSPAERKVWDYSSYVTYATLHE